MDFEAIFRLVQTGGVLALGSLVILALARGTALWKREHDAIVAEVRATARADLAGRDLVIVELRGQLAETRTQRDGWQRIAEVYGDDLSEHAAANSRLAAAVEAAVGVRTK